MIPRQESGGYVGGRSPYQGQYSFYHGDTAAPPPVTPLDLNYSQSMLPANLLMSSPYIAQQHSMIPMSPVPSGQFMAAAAAPPPPHMMGLGQMMGQGQMIGQGQMMGQGQMAGNRGGGMYQPAPVMQPPYMNSMRNSSLDQLNVSRTVLLKNLNEDLSLHELLDSIDFGPIEYCKMFSRPAPSHLKDVSNIKNCYISFINSKISIGFYLKYAKNTQNWNKLKDDLRNSKHLKLLLNENTNSHMSSSSSAVSQNKQDYLKLKTLNYIMEFNATRCINIGAELSTSEEPDAHVFEDTLLEQLAKFGEVEDIKRQFSEDKLDLDLRIHFSSIDSAIKSYEYCLKKIQQDSIREAENEESDQCNTGSKITRVSFDKDRCDRNPTGNLKQSSSDGSPLISRESITKESSEAFNDYSFLNNEDEEEISVLDEDEKSEKVLNPQDILDNNESIRTSLLWDSKPSDVSQNGALSSASSSQLLETSNASNGSFYLMNGSLPSNSMNIRSNTSQNHYNKGSAQYQYNPDPFNVGNRTIYLGNLHPNTSLEEIANNVRAGGLVESIKHHPARRVCFITFIDPTVALKFYLNHQVLHQLIIHGYDVTVGWARNHSGPLSREISLAVTAGASRNVYIGIKVSKDLDNPDLTPTDGKKRSLPDEETLRKDFTKFGDLEQINFYHNKDCGFLNFLNIISAIRLVELFETSNIAKINKIAGDNGEFYERYKHFKISFGKDRCGNPPKFSFKKKSGGRRRKKKEMLSESSSLVLNSHENHADEVEEDGEANQIDENTALIFGISSNGHVLNDSSTTESNDSEIKSDVALDTVNDKEEKESGGLNITLSDVNSNPSNDDGEKFKSDSGEPGGAGEAGDVGDEDEADGDEISIIINSSDTTVSSTGQDQKSTKKNSSTASTRFYSNKCNTSDPFIPSGATSKMSNHPSYSYNDPRYYKNNSDYQKFSQSPYIQHQQQLYYMPSSVRKITGGYNNYYVSNPNIYPSSFSLYTQPSGSYSTSGSQVMAQYLAKSQHDNLLYAASILSNDVGLNDGRDVNAKKNTRSGSK